MDRWHVYVVRTRSGTLYTGIATDVRRRIGEHERSTARGARALRGRGPLDLVFERRIGTRAMAQRVEARIKRLDRDGKERLLRLDPDRATLFDLLSLAD